MLHLFVKHQQLAILLGSLMLLFLVSLPSVLAAETQDGDVVHIKSNEVVDDDHFAAGREVIIDGVVKGDLIATGQSVTVNGTVEGDLLAGAQAVTINGEVIDDARMGAMVILINGTVGDDLNVGVFSLESGPESSIGGDLLAGAFQALIAGNVTGDIIGGFRGLQLLGQVGGNIDVDVDRATGGPSPVEFMQNIPNVPPLPTVPGGLTLDDDASVGGDLVYRSPVSAQIDGAAVAGEVEFNQRADQDERQDSTFVGWAWDQIQRLLRLLLFGLLAVWLAPAFMDSAGQKLQERLWGSLGWGITSPVIFLIVLLIVAFARFLVGFPTVVFGSLIFGYLLLLFYLGAVVVGLFLGRWLLQRFSPDRAEKIYLSMLVGLGIVWLITIIPILGTIIGVFIALFGIGSLWLVARDRMNSKGVKEATVVA